MFPHKEFLGENPIPKWGPRGSKVTIRFIWVKDIACRIYGAALQGACKTSNVKRLRGDV